MFVIAEHILELWLGYILKGIDGCVNKGLFNAKHTG